MPFASKTGDWRRLPTEARESFLAALQQRATAVADEYLSPVELAVRCGIRPDNWQEELLNSEDKQVILLCARQTGKSTISALIALHQTCYTPDSLSLVLSPSQRQSIETYRKIRDFYKTLEGVPDVTQESA